MSRTFSVEELAEAANLSTSGVKKAITDKRIKAVKENRSWRIDGEDPLVKKWLAAAEASKEPTVQELKKEIERLRRENENLGKRVRQAEIKQRRAEREARQLEAELAEAFREGQQRADENAQKIYDLSHHVIEEAAQENTRTLLKVVSMLANNPDKQILAGQVAPPVALPEESDRK